MKHKFEKVICVDTPYRPDKGSFARTTRVVDDRHKVDHWYFCRDIFHNILFNLIKRYKKDVLKKDQIYF